MSLSRYRGLPYIATRREKDHLLSREFVSLPATNDTMQIFKEMQCVHVSHTK
jgi:hypothetical protein